jgi:hypothetical protein
LLRNSIIPYKRIHFSNSKALRIEGVHPVAHLLS